MEQRVYEIKGELSNVRTLQNLQILSTKKRKMMQQRERFLRSLVESLRLQ